LTRQQLEHVIRAAADIVGGDEIVIIGSQAILGEIPNAPAALLVSQEADIYPRNDPSRADEIDGAIGDGSRFHETYGYYAHGVGPETAKGPSGWAQRLIRVTVRVRRGSDAVGWCMERHDIVLAKCVAGRERDWTYAEEALRYRLVDPEQLLRRSNDLPLPARRVLAVQRWLRAASARCG
jgi:hypothetical protein